MPVEPRRGERLILVVAVLALVGFGLIVVYLLGRTTEANETEWTRALYLLNGVEAIAFAAAGYLFGREVNRRRAEQAEERAEQAEERVEEVGVEAVEARTRAVEAESKGKALAAAIRAKGEVQMQEGLEGFSPQPPGQTDLGELDRLARELFPG